ncbi:glycerate kinase, partial [Microbacterium sp. AR7-10]|uniref:glycerate kinase family protein n=1 Tax=Microbacterium sp. AR7-10 TaxID=1891970 RepID=UPI001C42EE60
MPALEEQPALRVLLAFDSFKGSMTATEACRASATLLAERFGERVEVTSKPLADGGEGSLELLQAQDQVAAVTVQAVDAIGRPRSVEYLLDDTRRIAYIEVAEVVGLPAVSNVELRSLAASSYGAGLVVADALNRGAERLMIFLGGSATSDGGSGILEALGARLLDASGQSLGRGGGALVDLAEVDATRLLPSALAAEWVFVADVKAPLLGPTGAAQRYSPQKGAGPDQVAHLERALDHASALLERRTGRNLRARAGGGAAGGMQLFPAAFCSVEVVAGGLLLAAETGASSALENVDVVFTGEGRFDAQSLDGKVVGTLLEMAQLLPNRPPIVVIAGDTRAAAHLRSSGRLEGIAGVFGIAESAAELSELQADAAGLLARHVAELVSVMLLTGSRRSGGASGTAARIG